MLARRRQTIFTITFGTRVSLPHIDSSPAVVVCDWWRIRGNFFSQFAILSCNSQTRRLCPARVVALATLPATFKSHSPPPPLPPSPPPKHRQCGKKLPTPTLTTRMTMTEEKLDLLVVKLRASRMDNSSYSPLWTPSTHGAPTPISSPPANP